MPEAKKPDLDNKNHTTIMTPKFTSFAVFFERAAGTFIEFLSFYVVSCVIMYTLQPMTGSYAGGSSIAPASTIFIFFSRNRLYRGCVGGIIGLLYAWNHAETVYGVPIRVILESNWDVLGITKTTILPCLILIPAGIASPRHRCG